MIFGEYDREMDIAVNRREAREEGLEEGRDEVLKLFEQGLPVEEIKKQLQKENTLRR